MPLPDSLLRACPAGPENTFGEARESYRNETLCWRERHKALIDCNLDPVACHQGR